MGLRNQLRQRSFKSRLRPQADARHPPQPHSVGYDPRPSEDGARRRIAYALLALLWLVIAWILGLVTAGILHISELKDFGIILGPLVALVSAATGFYYGTKSRDSD